MVYKSNSFRAFQQSQPRKAVTFVRCSRYNLSTNVVHISTFNCFGCFEIRFYAGKAIKSGVVCHVCVLSQFPTFLEGNQLPISFETGTLVRYITFHHHDQCNNLLICCGVEHHVLDCIYSFKFRDTFIPPFFFDVDVWSGSHAAADAFSRVQRALRLMGWRFPSNSLCGMKPTSTMMLCRR